MDFIAEKVKIGNNFNIDEDGIMTVNACILKAGVFPYLESEFIEGASDQAVPVYIPGEEFTPAALESGEGRDVIIGDHIWRTAENSMHDGHTVGSIAGTLTCEDGKIFCKLRIDDAETVEKVKAKELVEISAGYRADFQQEDGTYEDKPYKYRQGNIVFNHVLLLPVGEGRCGSDVKVINKKKGVKQMSKTLRIKIGNVDKSVEFSNEDDAAKAEELVDEVKSTSAVDVENALEEVKALKEEVETKNAELEEKKQIIEEFKNKLEEALSPEKQEELAEELAEQKVAEDEVIEAEIDDEEEKEEVKNACKAMNRKDRIMYLTEMVLNKKGFDCSYMSEDRKIGAFQAIALEAHAKVQNKKNEKAFVPAAKALNAKAGPAVGSVARMFSFTGKK